MYGTPTSLSCSYDHLSFCKLESAFFLYSKIEPVYWQVRQGPTLAQLRQKPYIKVNDLLHEETDRAAAREMWPFLISMGA